MKKIDIIVALVVGELIALLSLGIFKNLEVKTEWLFFVWPIFLPVFCLFCLWLASIIAKKIPVIWQVAKFVLVGVLNTIVDLGILNILILLSGAATGLAYSLFKGVSFLCATVNSYYWNKYWTFEKKKTKNVKEFLQFFIVSLIGFAINVGVASMVVNLISPQFGLSLKAWANVGAIIATFCAMTWNFLRYKFIVFK